MKRFRKAGMEVDLVDDLTVLVRRRGHGVGRIRRAQLVEFLVPLAPDDEAAALCAVVILRPELGWMTRRSTRDPVGPDQAEADVVAVAWEVVTTKHECRSGPLPHKAVVNAIWTEVRRSAGLRRSALDIVPLADGFDQAAPEVDRLERWPGLLAAAVARGVLTPRQVALIVQTRIEQRPLRQVAVHFGRTYDSLRMERARAETALRQFALGSFFSEEE
jgi:DNA-directed RNA polymerase specialized sigma24 family protein